MKWTFIALLLAGLLPSCKDDDQIDLPSHLFMDNGDVTVLMNGEDISSGFTVRVAARVGSSTSCFPGKLNLETIYSISDNVQRKAFGVHNIPLQVGHYTISRIETGNQVCDSNILIASFATSVSDGDVQGDYYLPTENEDNFVSVASYNETTGEVTGTFQITFVIELEDEPPFKTDPNAPDTIRLTQGQFSAVIRERE